MRRQSYDIRRPAAAGPGDGGVMPLGYATQSLAELLADANAMAARLRAMAGPVKPNTLDDAAELVEALARRLADCTESQGEA